MEGGNYSAHGGWQKLSHGTGVDDFSDGKRANEPGRQLAGGCLGGERSKITQLFGPCGMAVPWSGASRLVA